MTGRALKAAAGRVRSWVAAVRERRAKRVDGVDTLGSLTPAERADLVKAGLATRRALWGHVSQHGLAATAGKTIDPVRLRDALAHYSLDEVSGKTRPLPVRALRQLLINWHDVLLVAALAAFAYGAWRAADRPERVVVAARDLAPFQLIRPADVRERRTEAGFGTFERADSVAGRFPLQALSAGDAIRRDRLSRVRFDDPAVLRNRSVVALPVTRTSAALAVPGSRVRLLFSPTERADTAMVLNDAVVLNARAAGDTSSVVVAVTPDDFHTLRPLLGRSLITVIQQPIVLSP